MDNSIPIDLLAYVNASKYRKKVLTALSRGMLTPMDISKETKIKPPNVTTTLKELSNESLVILKTYGIRKSKLYEITQKGLIMLKELNNLNKSKKSK